MIGMYGMYFLVQYYGLSYYLAAPLAIVLVAVLGVLLHYLVIAPLLGAAPINQLLATGGVLFVLQSFATVAFGIDFRNLGIRLPVLAFADMHFSYSRLLAFGAALIGMVVVYLFMTRTYTGTAIRAISQDRQIMALMGVDTQAIYLITSALGGALAGLAACLLVLQYDVHPFVGLSFGPITFLICVLGGLGNFVGGFVAAFVFAEIISLGGLYLRPRMGLRAGLRLLHRHDVRAARRACWRGAHERAPRLADRRRGADRAAVRLSRSLSPAHPDPHPDLVVRLHLVVDDGPLRPGVAGPWRLHGRRRLRDGAAVEPSRHLAVDRHPDRAASAPARWRWSWPIRASASASPATISRW